MSRHTRLGLFAPLVLLASCATWDHEIASSVHCDPGEQKTLRIRSAPPGDLTVELRGEGPGAVTFEACAPHGTVVARGMLHTAAEASCRTSEGDLVIEFHATGEGGTVAYEARAALGIEVTLEPAPR